MRRKMEKEQTRCSAFSFPLSPCSLSRALPCCWRSPGRGRWSPGSPGASRTIPAIPLLNTWILWWNTQAVPFTDAWWSPPVFYPMPGSVRALGAPRRHRALHRAAAARSASTPIAAYNVALILSSWLSGCLRLPARTQADRIGRGRRAGGRGLRASRRTALAALAPAGADVAVDAARALRHARLPRRSASALAGALRRRVAAAGAVERLLPAVLSAADRLWLRVVHRLAARSAAAASRSAATFAASSLLLVPVLLKYREVHGRARARAVARRDADVQRARCARSSRRRTC